MLFVILVLPLTSCMERKTDNPMDSYTLWSGQAPDKQVSVTHGKYWESAHFTREYIVYLELTAPPSWVDKYVAKNKLTRFTKEIILPTDKPVWFKLPQRFIAWKHPQDEQSIYIEDTETANFFIYEEQL